MTISKLVALTLSHSLLLAVGFALGVYTLPILSAPDAPTRAQVESLAGAAQYRGRFSRDLKGSEYLDTRIRHERARGRLGKALAAVSAKLGKYPRRRSLYEARLEILRELGFTHWVALEKAWMGIRYPSAYPPF